MLPAGSAVPRLAGSAVVVTVVSLPVVVAGPVVEAGSPEHPTKRSRAKKSPADLTYWMLRLASAMRFREPAR